MAGTNTIKKGSLCVKDIPVELKNYFKAHCAKMGETMSENIIKYMTQVIRDSRKADE